MPLADPDATVTELRTSTHGQAGTDNWPYSRFVVKGSGVIENLLDRRPELGSVAAQIMKTVKATHREIEALNEATQQNGKLDKAALDQALDRILKAAREINREVNDLLAKARR